jgi:3-dehydroquinate synthase
MMNSNLNPIIKPEPTQDLLQHKITVEFQHRVYFQDHLFNQENSLLPRLLTSHLQAPRARVAVFIDSGVLANWPGLWASIQRSLVHPQIELLQSEPWVVPGGERAKHDPSVFEGILSEIHRTRLCRHSTALAIGGGAVLDAVGLAAALAHRGVRLIRVPTTVLAQNDAGIGIKNGVDHFGIKNYLGTFQVPTAVINDAEFLTTLSPADWRDGMAEALKVAALLDSDFFKWIELNARALRERDLKAMKSLIRRCAELHLRHIAQGGDPFELGSARPLDFGHWSAHRLEQLSDFRLTHGAAVALGICIDSTYSQRIGLLPESDLARILDCVNALGFTPPKMTYPPKQILQGLKDFQEHLGGQLSVSLLKGIGVPAVVHEVDETLMTSVLNAVLQPKIYSTATT